LYSWKKKDEKIGGSSYHRVAANTRTKQEPAGWPELFFVSGCASIVGCRRKPAFYATPCSREKHILRRNDYNKYKITEKW
jgi:hypothetical protein